MQVTPVLDDQEVDAALPLRPAGRAVDAGRAARGVDAGGCRSSRSDHDQFRVLLERSTRDLAALRIFDPEYPDRAVVAAGAPWFMTLFGRDSLLTSWMTMLVDPDLALGTLQTLARFQGEQVDPLTEEEPGRILHEMRFGETASLALGGGRVYYGTADATPLFVMLLGELSRWGSRRDEVDALLPAADRALEWITEYGDKDGDGYVEYAAHERSRACRTRAGRTPGTRCASWTARSRRHRSRCARCRATCTRALIARSHFATEAGDHELARVAAEREPRELKRRFNEDFWVDDDDGGYFAMGLDRDKRQIDGIGSNMGHCLWTGIVDEEKAAAVAAHAHRTRRCSAGWGDPHARRSRCTATTRSRYHCGSVWPHDNAICAAGLMRYGFVDEAHRVMLGLVEASAWFGNLLPELFAGIAAHRGRVPGAVPDVVLAAGVGGGVAVAVPAHDAALRARLPELRAAPRAGDPRVDRPPPLERIPVMGGHLTIDVEGDSLDMRRSRTASPLVHTPRQAAPSDQADARPRAGARGGRGAARARRAR